MIHTLLDRAEDFLCRHGDVILMLLAQVCSAVLSTIGRLLRTGLGDLSYRAMGTSEVLFFMMFIITVLSWLYISFSRPLGAPFGQPEVRSLLLLRGFAGFIGIWGFYYSLGFLAVAEATILNFMAPLLAVLVLGIFPGKHCSTTPLIAGLVSIAGVVCVLEPWTEHRDSSPREHVWAIGAAAMGVLGGAMSYIVISRIGNRVHPILNIAYFSTICTALNGIIILGSPNRHLHLFATTAQWSLVLLLGVMGFVMHLLLVSSLTWGSDSNRALNFVYTQVTFAMLADKIFWAVSPSAWKIAGTSLIIVSAVFVAIRRPGQGHEMVEGEKESDEEGLSSEELDELMEDSGYGQL